MVVEACGTDNGVVLCLIPNENILKHELKC